MLNIITINYNLYLILFLYFSNNYLLQIYNIIIDNFFYISNFKLICFTNYMYLLSLNY